MTYTPASWIYKKELSSFCQFWKTLADKSTVDKIRELRNRVKKIKHNQIQSAIYQVLENLEEVLENGFLTQKEEYEAFLVRLHKNRSELTSFYRRGDILYTGGIDDIQKSIDIYENLENIQSYFLEHKNQEPRKIPSPYELAFDMFCEAYQNMKSATDLNEEELRQRQDDLWGRLEKYKNNVDRNLPEQ